MKKKKKFVCHVLNNNTLKFIHHVLRTITTSNLSGKIYSLLLFYSNIITKSSCYYILKHFCNLSKKLFLSYFYTQPYSLYWKTKRIVSVLEWQFYIYINCIYVESHGTLGVNFIFVFHTILESEIKIANSRDCLPKNKKLLDALSTKLFTTFIFYVFEILRFLYETMNE